MEHIFAAGSIVYIIVIVALAVIVLAGLCAMSASMLSSSISQSEEAWELEAARQMQAENKKAV